MSLIIEFEEKQLELIRMLVRTHIEATTEQWDQFYSVVDSMKKTYTNPNVRTVDCGDLLIALREEVDLSVTTLSVINQAVSSQPKQDFTDMGKLGL